MKRVALPPHWRDRAIVISDVTDPESWLDPEELHEVSAFRLEKRRSEWMLSRIAAKQLAIELGLCSDPRSCRIADRRLQTRYVSLSHTHGYAAAAIDVEPVGIDVELVRRIDPRAAHLFLSNVEEDLARGCELPNALLHFWCAKEAAWKRLGGAVTTLAKVSLRVVTTRADGVTFEGVETLAADGLVIAVTSG